MMLNLLDLTQTNARISRAFLRWDDLVDLLRMGGYRKGLSPPALLHVLARYEQGFGHASGIQPLALGIAIAA